MASGLITSCHIEGEKVETVTDFLFLGFKITAGGDCSHEIRRWLLFGRRALTNLDSVLKSKDITLLAKVRIVNAMVFPVVMCGCESWTIKKAVFIVQLCPTLWDPMDCSLLGSSVYGILQARILEWVAIAYSWPRDWTQVFCITGRFCIIWATKEGWALKNWCFQTVVLEGTLDSPLENTVIKPVNLKGNQPWILFGRTDAEAPILWPPDVNSWLIVKDPGGG